MTNDQSVLAAADPEGLSGYIEAIWERAVLDDTKLVISLIVMAFIVVFGGRALDYGKSAIGRVFGSAATVGLVFALFGGFWIGWWFWNMFTRADGGLLGSQFPYQSFGDLWDPPNRLWTGFGIVLGLFTLAGIRGFMKFLVAPAAFIGFLIVTGVLRLYISG